MLHPFLSKDVAYGELIILPSLCVCVCVCVCVRPRVRSFTLHPGGRLSVGAMHHAESMSSISSFQRRQMGRQEQQQQKQQEEAELRMARVPSGLASSHVVASDSTKDVSTAGKSSPKPPAKAPKPPKKGDDERKKHQKEGE